MAEFIEQLEETGLSSKEAEVYIALLKNSPIGGGKLAKLINMDRTHVYNLLRNLVNKGLASHITKQRKTFFQTTSPKNLLNQIKKREQTIKSIIPKLESLEKIEMKDSSVNVLEGKSGLRTFIRILLDSKTKEILVFGGTGKSFEVLEYEMPHVAKSTELLKMEGKIITSKKLIQHEMSRLKNFEVKYVEELTNVSTMIFNNFVSIQIFDQKPTIILIENKSVANSYRKYFKYLWKTARR